MKFLLHFILLDYLKEKELPVMAIRYDNMLSYGVMLASVELKWIFRFYRLGAALRLLIVICLAHCTACNDIYYFDASGF